MNYLRFMLILFACGSLSFGIAFAQDDATNGGTVRGQVTDLTPAQNPIENVEVKIIAQAQDGGKEWTTKTDADGNYKHAGLPAGRYLISISKDGYDKRIGKPVTVVDGGEHFVPLKMAQKGDLQRFFEVQQVRRHLAIKQEIKPRVESLLQGIAESVSRRYDLDPAAVDTLRLSILESVEIALKRDGNIHVFAKAVEGGSVGLLKVLLSRLDCKVLFAKHLSEAQLQDYVNVTEARRQLDQQAVARWITVALDKELSLTVDQRGKIVKLLHGAAQNRDFPVSMSALRISPQQAVHLVHYRLKISLDDILSEAQSKVWHGLVSTNANREHFAVFMPEAGAEVVVVDKVDVGEIVDPNKKRAFIHKEAIKPVKVERKVNVVINEIAIDPPGRQQPWIELNAGTAASPE
ncbi:MAG: carboxypeptidase-like regulatory domain-containing protein [Candidatus Poribacteria bacterium]|nr:carboxypeptidase-like regulatory domain-containing protein [Candidatus Poribacteria bacterium]